MFHPLARVGFAIVSAAALLIVAAAGQPPSGDHKLHFDTSKLKPLTDMSKDDVYQGFPGGLYPDVSNVRPAAHEKLGLELAGKVRPLDPAGMPSADGKIVLLTVGFSNTSQCSEGFLEAAAADKGLNPRLVLVNGAQGARSAFMMQNPDDHSVGEEYWRKWVAGKLKDKGVTAAQVQVIWLKQTAAGVPPEMMKRLSIDHYDSPARQGFPRGAQALEAEIEKIVLVLPRLFPNLKMVYLSSRSFSGWSNGMANPEPFCYETGYAVKWLIEKQLKGDPALNCDPGRGPVNAPWLSWGPYLWANGSTPRADGFCYQYEDYRENDHLHHSAQGIKKMGNVLLQFFKTDSTTKAWFVGAGQ